MSNPVQRLDKNGTMFSEKLAEKRDLEAQAAEDEAEKKKKKKMDGSDITGDLLDGFIATLTALRKRM